MSKFDKFKTVFNIGSTVASPFLPKGASSILNMIKDGLNGSSASSAAAIKALAEDNDAQTAAINELARQLIETNKRVAALENK